MQLVVRSVIVGLLLLPLAAIAGDTAGFNGIDTDKSGSISMDELLKADLVAVSDPSGAKRVMLHDADRQGKGKVLTSDQKRALFRRIDSDKNGSISHKEWDRASPNGFILWKF